MITVEEFEKLIENPESTILDYKRDMYDFENDIDNEKTAKFAKDIISFCNTIRTEKSFIIIGIKAYEDGTKDYIGIQKHYDEAMLQSKIKDKILPAPYFEYYTIEYDSKKYGVFEFPIKKYDYPLYATLKMKGITPSMPYYRQGTKNTEAIGNMVIHINDWLKNLPSEHAQHKSSMNDEITNCLSLATNVDIKLSLTITEVYKTANKYGLVELKRFCKEQIDKVTNTDNKAENQYRAIKTNFCLGHFASFGMYDAAMIKSYLQAQDNFHSVTLLYQDSIIDIESKLKQPNSSFNAIKSNMNKIQYEGNKVDGDITIIIFKENYEKLYSSIRQRLISILIEI